jgi:hypothetical protein
MIRVCLILAFLLYAGWLYYELRKAHKETPL